jgi:hypothetical protein
MCHAFHVSPHEDALVGNCLAKSGIFPYNFTRDNLGRQRFHLFYLGFEYEYRSLPEELRTLHWYQNYDKDIRSGDDCCSDQSISAQYLTDFWMYGMDDFIYRCPKQRKDEFYRDKPEGFFDRRGYSIVIPNT